MTPFKSRRIILILENQSVNNVGYFCFSVFAVSWSPKNCSENVTTDFIGQYCSKMTGKGVVCDWSGGSL